MRSLHAVAVVTAVTLVALAGCSGLPASGSDAPSTESTEYPPGVTETGLDDARALVDAHVESVREHGATVNSTATVSVPLDEPTTAELSGAGRAAPNSGPVYWMSERLRVSVNDTATRERVETYANDTTVVRRVVIDGNASVEREQRDRLTEFRDRHVARERLLLRTLTAGNFSVAGVESRESGRAVTTLVANEQSLGDGDGDSASVFSARLTATERGRVLSLSFTRDLNTTDSRTGREMEVTWTNGTTVEPPAWAR